MPSPLSSNKIVTICESPNPEGSPSFVDIVKGALQSLPYRDWRLVNLSIALNTSQRTIQRRLKAERVHLRDILQEGVILFAKGQLERGFTAKVIACELGYAYTAFHRAFRRETGMTIRQYKASLGRNTEDQ